MNFYLIEHPKKSVVLYTEGERTPLESPDSIKSLVDHWVDWLTRRGTRVANLFKRLTIVVRDYYNRLEYKIDPMEHVFKLMRHASEIRLHYALVLPETRAAEMLEQLCCRQRNKHLFWFGVDLVITLVAILLSPILIPLPGPNIFFYYPGLRTISHFLAWRGVLHGRRLKARFFFPQEEISDIQTFLKQDPEMIDFEQVRQLARRMRLEQLPHFLERFT
jgi:K+-H+ exchange-related protein